MRNIENLSPIIRGFLCKPDNHCNMFSCIQYRYMLLCNIGFDGLAHGGGVAAHSCEEVVGEFCLRGNGCWCIGDVN
jgi:hypothetical protein